MGMIYFRNPETDVVHAYDEDEQAHLIVAAIDSQWVEVDNWPQVQYSQNDLKALLDTAVTSHIDGVARARGYTNAAYLVSYCNSTCAQWAKDANIFVPWRDTVWMQCLDIQSEVLAGTRGIPTAEELIAELTAIAWVDL